MKILFLTPTLPFPPVSGGVIKSNKVVHFLSGRYTLTVACFLKNEDPQYVEEFKTTVKLSGLITEALDIPRNAKNLILSNLLGIPLNLYRNRSATFNELVSNAARDADIIFCDHYVMFQYVPKDFKGKVILHEHNCEYLIWQRYAEIETKLLKKLALLNQAYRIRHYEQKICRRADVVLAAPNDTDELEKIGADRKKFLETYHLGDDELLKLPDLEFSDTEASLLYVGTLSWEANIDGLSWFFNECWRSIAAKHPGIKLYIVGKHPDPRLKAMADADPNIILTGFVEDLEPYFRRNRVFITPLRFGSGIKVKVVNALYRGIPCVTTSIGAEGLKVIDGEQLFIRDRADAFTAAVDVLLEDEESWKKLSRQARQLARQYYTWEFVLENIRKAVEG